MICARTARAHTSAPGKAIYLRAPAFSVPMDQWKSYRARPSCINVRDLAIMGAQPSIEAGERPAQRFEKNRHVDRRSPALCRANDRLRMLIASRIALAATFRFPGPGISRSTDRMQDRSLSSAWQIRNSHSSSTGMWSQVILFPRRSSAWATPPEVIARRSGHYSFRGSSATQVAAGAVSRSRNPTGEVVAQRSRTRRDVSLA